MNMYADRTCFAIAASLFALHCGSSASTDGGLEAASNHDSSTAADVTSLRDAAEHNDAASDASTEASTDASASDATATDGSLPPVTVSSWLGTNVSGDLPFVDITLLMSPFDTAAAQVDANGYPIAGASGTSSTDLGFQLPTGQYNITYAGDGTVVVSGIGALMGAWTTSGAEHRNVVAITGTPGSFGQILTVTVTNGASGNPVQNLHILMPGYAADTTQTFTTEFIALLTPFRALRMMG